MLTDKQTEYFFNENLKESEEVYQLFYSIDDFYMLLRNLLERDCALEEKFKSISRASFLIASELGGRHFGEPKIFDVLPIQKSFQTYIYKWDRFFAKDIPFSEWSDLAEEGLDLLKSLLDENNIESYESDDRYVQFMRKFVKRHEELRLNKGYDQPNELMAD